MVEDNVYKCKPYLQLCCPLVGIKPTSMLYSGAILWQLDCCVADDQKLTVTCQNRQTYKITPPLTRFYPLIVCTNNLLRIFQEPLRKIITQESQGQKPNSYRRTK